MHYITDYHSKFLQKAFESSRLLPNFCSAIPTLIFLTSSFVFLYQHVHRKTNLHTKWKSRILRDLKLHWIYFNITRLWFIFISCCKRLVSVADDYIDINLAEKDKEFNQAMTHSAAVMIVATLSVIPVFLVYVNYLSKYDIPNFLMWVMEDPYLRHEIGISGHCLERPLRVDSKKMKNYPYRSRRSTSFDTNPWVSQRPPIICRNCKSMIEHNVVNSIEEMH